MRYLFFILISSLYLWANGHIFIYHRFEDPKRASANTSLEELRKEFNFFKENGYKVVPLSSIIDKINKNENIPDNWVALTIDDAYKSFYYNALPLFKEFNYPFSLYIYVEATNKRYGDFMTWSEIKEASKYGEIGLHSYSHPRLTHMSDDIIKKDTEKSLKIFEENMGFKPKGYAYPYGEYNDNVKKIISSYGFDYILNQTSGSVNKNSDLMNLHRIALVGKVNIKQKLRYKTLEVKWFEPKLFPKDGVLTKVKAKVDKSIKYLHLYVTGKGWIENIKVKDGLFEYDLNYKLTKARTRVILSTNYYTIATKLIIKDKNTK